MDLHVTRKRDASQEDSLETDVGKPTSPATELSDSDPENQEHQQDPEWLRLMKQDYAKSLRKAKRDGRDGKDGKHLRRSRGTPTNALRDKPSSGASLPTKGDQLNSSPTSRKGGR